MISPLPKAKAKPIAQYMIAAIEKLVRIFATTVPAFLPREKPISSSAKPACIQITSSAATTTQIELIGTLSGRTPCENASEVSAYAPAGASSAPAIAPPSANRIFRNVIGPPRSGITSRSVGADRAGVFGPVSKVLRSAFAEGRGVLQRAKRSLRMFIHVDTRTTRGRE